MTKHASGCNCDDCWLARRVQVLEFRKRPDDRYTRSLDAHSAYAYKTGRCKCDDCRDAANALRRKYRK